MLKHFHLGRRASFPVIFLGAVTVLLGGEFAILQFSSVQTFTQAKNPLEFLIAAIGVAAAFTHFLYSQHHQDTQTFVSLFEKFNARYDKLNEKLNSIVTSPIGSQLDPGQRATLYDYFNLCAEEHMFYETGYIDERVWQAWLRGMKQFAKDDSVRRLWEQEIATGSYYNFELALVDAVDLEKTCTLKSVSPNICDKRFPASKSQ